MLSHLDTVEFLIKAASNTNNYLKAGPGDYLSGIGDRQHSTHFCHSRLPKADVLFKLSTLNFVEDYLSAIKDEFELYCEWLVIA